MPPWALVSPASRGIGFALARRILETTNVPVVATARKDPEKLRDKLRNGLDISEERLRVLKVDVLDENTITEAAAACKDFHTKNSLQLAFIVPGLLFPEKSPAQINAEDALLTFRTNTLGPMLMIKHFSPFLPKKSTKIGEGGDAALMEGLPPYATMTVMSARVGSISDNMIGGWYSYRASKAGVNQIVKTFDNHLRAVSGDNAIAIALHPGTVKTKLSKEFWDNVKPGKLFESDWVAKSLMEVVNNVGIKGRGKCWDWQGKEILP
ncbi:hypothetical protein BDV96DRAFT_612036 [Lophiotrema nucula]|uniref:NAD(P)-binding protein n=1 Tax=Lophiotrema nucula TaxID=690887 RepID=A0A6A5ZCI7_9PLEO|nr:hypothetical protein BDV96DRAFT_612036 [Lophiotrema nucula]